MRRPGGATVRAILALAAAGALVSGCLPTRKMNASSSGPSCLKDNARFDAAWICIKGRLAAREAGADPKRDGLIEEGDLLAEQVRTGKLSEAEGRRRLSAGMAHEVEQ